VGTAAAVLAGLIVVLVTRHSVAWPKLGFEFLVFLALYVAAEARPVYLPRFVVSVSFMTAVVAIIQLPAAAVALVCGLGPLGKLLGKERPVFYKLVFNMVQYTVAGGLASLTYQAFGGLSELQADVLPQMILATSAATFVFFTMNTAAVSGAIAIESGAHFLRTWKSNFGWLTATYFAFGASGIVLSGLYQVVGVLSLPLLFVPFLVARTAFHSYDEVSEAYDKTVRAFVQAIDAKDSYTRGHSERVADYSKLIAERMGMRERDLQVFYYGALLHDVGKLVVRKRTLTKPTKLDDEEWDEIKRHPVVGAEIVKEIDFLEPALDAVLSHHERLDGTGYPAGLTRDLVPMNARIMAVADTYDAMTSTRAYRGARTPQEAIDELKRCVGTLFDEHCVNEFMEALAEQLPAQSGLSFEAKAVPGTAG
jgi:putative nucleotidyltransferase with HDIG domain